MNGVLLIRFSIEKLNELPGPYDFQTGFLVGKAVPARLLRGMTILQGDTPQTLLGLEYVTMIAIRGDRDLLRREIEPRIVLNEDISRRKAEPLTQLTDDLGTSLGSVGIVQPDGLSDTGWCSKGFLYAWN